MRLLPTPVLSFTDIRIGDPASPDLAVERFRAEVELTPLLRGEVRIIQMRVERPNFRIDLARPAAGLGALIAGWRIDPERISLARVEIADGTAEIQDRRTGRAWRAESIEALVEARSLRGPGKIQAAVLVEGEPILVRVAAGRMRADYSVPARVIVTSPRYPLVLTADGSFASRAGEAPSFSGSAVLVGLPPEDEDDPPSPWAEFRAQGRIALTPEALAVEEAQISYGATERPLILAGAGRLDFAGEPRFDVSLKARQIDLDRTFAAGPDRPASIKAGVASFLRAVPGLPKPPIPGILHVDAQGVVVGGSVMQAVGLDVATAPEGWQVEDFAALLPGETRVDLAGMVRTVGGLGFRGHGKIKSARPAAFAAWWRGQAGSAVEIDGFSIEADLDLAADIQHLANIVATTGEGTVEGLVELRTFQQTGQSFLNLDLRADRADVVEARALAELLAGDALARQRFDQVSASLSAGVLTAGEIEARTVMLDGGLEEGVLQLRRLAIADLAGAAIEARGSLRDPFGERSGRLEGSVEAHDIAGAAEFLARLVPDNRIVASLRAVAPSLSPVAADVSAEIGAGEAPLRFDLTGSFADTHLTLAAAGQGDFATPESWSGAVDLHVDGEDSAAVLAQIGLDPVPVRAGPLRLDARFERAPGSTGTLSVDGTIAGIEVAYTAETALAGGDMALAGDFSAEAFDIDPVLLLAGIAVPGLGEGHAAAAAGRLEIAPERLRVALSEASFAGQSIAGALEADLRDGVDVKGDLHLRTASLPILAALAVGSVPRVGPQGWSDDPFAAVLPPDVGFDVRLRADELDLGLPIAASDATIGFEAERNRLEIDLLQAGFAGGTLKGAIAAGLSDGEVAATLRASLQGAELQRLLWQRNGLPAASGKLDLSFEATGSGRTAAGIVAALSGSGSFALGEGRLNGLNPAALDAAMKAGETEGEPDIDKVREQFAILFGSGAFPFGRAAGSFSINSGVVNVATASVSAAGTDVLADATIDLNALQLASNWTIRRSGGADEQKAAVAIRFSGPVADPERQVDLAPLLDTVRSRYLQRQLDELEALEQARRRFEAAEAERIREQTEERRLDRGYVWPSAPEAAPAPYDLRPPIDLLPQEGAAIDPAADLVQQMRPAVEDVLRRAGPQ